MLGSLPSRQSGRRGPLAALCALALGTCVLPACGDPPPVQSLNSGSDAGGAQLIDALPGADAATSRSDAALEREAEVEAGSLPPPPQEAAGDAAPPSDAAVEPLDAGVGVSPARVRSQLALPERWVQLDAAADPFEDRLAQVHCLPEAVMAETLAEERVLSVDTGFCDYVTATQPALRGVAQGEILKLRLWHFELSADEPAEAHAVVMVDGLRILDERIPIPQPGGLISRQLAAERAIPAGAPLYFHLHNHGANSWALVELSAGP